MTNRECYELIAREGVEALYNKGFMDGRHEQILRSCNKELSSSDIALNTLKDFKTMLTKQYLCWMQSGYDAKVSDAITYLEELICSRENG